MQKLVYYAVPNGKENCEGFSEIEVIVRDSEHIYENFLLRNLRTE